MSSHEIREIGFTHVKVGDATIRAIPSVFKTAQPSRIGNANQQKCTYYAPEEETILRKAFTISIDGRLVPLELPPAKN